MYNSQTYENKIYEGPVLESINEDTRLKSTENNLSTTTKNSWRAMSNKNETKQTTGSQEENRRFPNHSCLQNSYRQVCKCW